MSKQRALELCGYVELHFDKIDSHYIKYSLAHLRDAILELAKDDPEPNPTPDLSIHRARIGETINRAILARAIDHETGRKLFEILGY